MFRRDVLFAAILIASAAFAAPALAGKPAVYTGVVDGVGAGGYDVVAYQTQDAAVAGVAAVTAAHDGVTYRFASEANKAAFEADPARYLPQYGGYCAWAVSQGYTAHGDPEAWSVVDDRLYLNYSKGVRAQWQRDTQGNIAKGEANWPGVLE
jgi:YHS domain-containing protein